MCNSERRGPARYAAPPAGPGRRRAADAPIAEPMPAPESVAPSRRDAAGKNRAAERRRRPARATSPSATAPVIAERAREGRRQPRGGRHASVAPSIQSPRFRRGHARRDARRNIGREHRAQAGDRDGRCIDRRRGRDLLKLEPNAACGFVREPMPARSRSRPAVSAPVRRRTPPARALFHDDAATPVKLHRIKNDQLYHYYLGDPIEAADASCRRHATPLPPSGPTSAPASSCSSHPWQHVPHRAHRGERRWFLGASTEWPGVVPADVELGDAEALAAKYPTSPPRSARFPIAG